jgi:hypothetical protein
MLPERLSHLPKCTVPNFAEIVAEEIDLAERSPQKSARGLLIRSTSTSNGRSRDEDFLLAPAQKGRQGPDRPHERERQRGARS